MHSSFKHRGFALTLGAFLTFSALGAMAADGQLTTLATRLASLRGDVEALSESIETEKTRTQQALRSIATQKAELDVQVQKEALRLKLAQQARKKHLDRVASSQAQYQSLKPGVLASLNKMRVRVKRGLPFKQDARVAELDKIESQLKKGMLSPQKAAARLWQFYEDEMRLTRESGMYRQTVEVDGQQMLVDVARLGMVAMYFKAQDGRVGIAKRSTDSSWIFATTTDQVAQAQINTLFDAFKKNIRVGYFTLPEAFVVSGGGQP